MMRAPMAVYAAVLMLAAVAGCSGISADDVQDTAKAVRAGESLNERRDYPQAGVQLYAFTAGRPIFRTDLWYIIDLRAHLCYSTLSRSETAVLTPVPCKALKAGYPLVAPLITWDDAPATAPEYRMGSAPSAPSSIPSSAPTSSSPSSSPSNTAAPAQTRPAPPPSGPAPRANPVPMPAGR